MMSRIKQITILEVVAFVSGAALMIYELVASRMLAPTIGSSTYVWTSVIGVIIAALALGYTVGGKLADMRTAIGDIAWLLLFVALAMLGTLLSADSVLEILPFFIPDTRFQGVVAAILLFMPASFLLGAISPYLVRLRLDSLKTAGSSVASLSALNSLGGIVGTFCAGFILFGFIGSSETLAILLLLLVALSWAIIPRYRLRIRLAVSIVIGISVILSFAAQANAASIKIDTASSHYKVTTSELEGRKVRFLSTGPSAIQSGVFLEGSKDLTFNYTRKIAELISRLPAKNSILILGGGAYSLPEFLARQYPASRIDVVEIDPELSAISKQYFRYEPTSNITAFSQDARAFLNTTTKKYDIVIVDVYSDVHVPFALATREYAEKLATVLKPDATVLANVIGSLSPACEPLLKSLHSAYMQAFKDYRVYPLKDKSLNAHQNMIIAYSLGQAHLQDDRYPMIPVGDTFSDNFAPIERMQRHCQLNG